MSVVKNYTLVLGLEQGSHVIFHCAAGMHRTGVCMYLLLRHIGYTQQETMILIEQARPVTSLELRRSTRKNGILCEKAESLFQELNLAQSKHNHIPDKIRETKQC